MCELVCMCCCKPAYYCVVGTVKGGVTACKNISTRVSDACSNTNIVDSEVNKTGNNIAVEQTYVYHVSEMNRD